MAQSALDCANSALRKLGGTTVTAVDGTDTSKEGLAIFGHLDPCKKQLLRRNPWNFAIKRKTLVAPTAVTLTTPFAASISSGVIRYTVASHSFVAGNYITAISTGSSESDGVFEVTATTATTVTVSAPGVASLTGTPVAGSIRLSPAFDYSVIYAVPTGFLKLISVNEGIISGRHKLEGGYILSDEATAIKIRYVGDVTDYTIMDTDFYECLSTYLAWTICDHITGSDQKKRDLWTDLNGGDGKSGMLSKARFDDAIEDSIQYVESNEWLSARVCGAPEWTGPVTTTQTAV